MSGDRDLYHAATFEEFWRSYVEMHARPETRRLHAAATITAITLATAGVATGSVALVVAAPIADYAIAQLSHRVFEKNRTTPWKNPFWHARAEIRMFRLVLAGRRF